MVFSQVARPPGYTRDLWQYKHQENVYLIEPRHKILLFSCGHVVASNQVPVPPGLSAWG